VNCKEQELIALGIALMLLGSVLGIFAVYMPTFVMAKMKTKSGDIPDENDSSPVQGNEQGQGRLIPDDKVHVPEQGWIKGKWTGGSDEMFEKGPDGDGRIPPGFTHGGCKPLNDSPPY
jgi:hypothetical protein